MTHLLAALRDDEPGTPSTVDVQRAIRSGRRRRRARQLAGAGVIAAVTALIVAVVPTMFNEALPPARKLGEFDLMRREVSVGSAGGFSPVSYETGRYRQVVRLVDGSDGRATVTVYAAGRFDGPERAEVTDLNGEPAYWLPSRSAVAWEWAPDAWAVAEATGGRARAHRVAQSVLPHQTRVQVPFPVPDLPAPYRLAGVITPYDPAAGTLLVLDADGTRVLLGVRRDLDRDFTTGDRRSSPVANTEVDGRSAAVSDTSVTIFDSGLAVVAEADGPAPDLVALATSVRPG